MSSSRKASTHGQLSFQEISGPTWEEEENFLRQLKSAPHSRHVSKQQDMSLHIAGVDEVGRGPWAGPVVAAAVILNPRNVPCGLNDSKKLSSRKRQELYSQIMEKAVSVSVCEASVAEIDEMNILRASLLAMRRAVAGLSVRPDACLVDGNRDPELNMATKLLVKGDGRSLSVAAASIIAKVFRDRLMAKLAEKWPDYGWEKNAGYGVPHHTRALELVGVSPHHRKSFKPILSILSEE